MQAISQEGDEDMGFDALFEPMLDRSQSEIDLERPEGGLDLGQLNIELPQLCGLLAA